MRAVLHSLHRFVNRTVSGHHNNRHFRISRTRNALWMKGETSGNKLQVLHTLVDCDDDTVLLRVKRLGDGNVCHTGTRTCFRTL